MKGYSTCVACGEDLMFTPITKRWVHVGGDAGISHYPTPETSDLDVVLPDYFTKEVTDHE
jgi:hypothetical protein